LILHGRPFESPLENRIALFNEIMVSLYLYILMTLTDFMGPNPIMGDCAMSLVGVIVVAFAVNLGKTVYLIFKAAVLYCKRKKGGTVALKPIDSNLNN
jgi:hypothetical protein